MRSSRIVAMFLSIAVLATAVTWYTSTVHDRRHANECKRDDARHGYVGELCLLPYADGTLFRLYNASTGELLAERTYNDPDPSIVFGADRVYYNIGALPEPYVQLPPTLLDRTRAKLP